MKRKILLIILLSMQSIILYAQKDTLFWFSPPKITPSISNLTTKLYLKSFNESAIVSVQVPANNGFATQIISIPANSIQIVDLTSAFGQIYSSANTVNNNGVFIESSKPISAEWAINNSTIKEDFVLKGSMALGTDFYTIAQKQFNVANSGMSGFSLVATENNTTVLITPKTNSTTSNQSNVSSTTSIVLQRGQTYFVNKNDASFNANLTGSIVSSNHPVAVTVYEDITNGNGCSDLIGDQLISTKDLGNRFVVPRIGTEGFVYVMAVENGTEVTYNGASTLTDNLSWGEAALFPLSADFNLISSNKKVYVYQVVTKDCEYSATLVPNASCAGSYITNVVRKTNDDFSVVLFTRSGFERHFSLNGNPIDLQGLTYNAIPGTNGEMVGIVIPMNDVPVGQLIQVANSMDVFAAATYNGSANNGSFYSFASDYTVTTFANAGNNSTTCANVDFELNGLVGGGPITGMWTSSGYGSFESSETNLVNRYRPNPLDVLISPIKLVLTTTGDCPSKRDTLLLTVSPLPIVNASVDQIVCANNSNVQLRGTVQQGATTGRWTTHGTGVFEPNAETLNAVYIPSNQDFLNTNITLTLSSTDNGSCATEMDQMQITFTNPAVVNIPDDSIVVCFNNNVVQLEGIVSGSSTTGRWITQGSGMFFPNNIVLNTSYQPGMVDLTNRAIWVYLESTNNGQCLAVRDSVKVIITPAPIVDAGLNRLICMDQDTIHLTGTANAHFGGTWSGGFGTFDNQNALNTFYTISQDDKENGSVIFTLRSENNANCVANSDLVQFNFVEIPFVNFTIEEGCLDALQTLTNFSLPGSGSIDQSIWNFGNDEIVESLNTRYRFPNAGNFPVELTIVNSNGCRATGTQTAIVHQKPTAGFDYSTECNFQTVSVQFTDLAAASDGIASYLYDLGGQENISTPDFSFDFKQVGTYNVSQIVTSINGCTDTLMRTITVEPYPVAGFAYNFTSALNVGSTYNFVDTSSNAQIYFWELGNGTTLDIQHPTINYFENGYYNIVQWVYNSLGCYDSTSLWIEINTITSDIQTLIPNVISPNGDGYNDVWKLAFIEMLYPNAEVTIFNSWGQELFASKGYKEPWDATFNGEELPDGNYYYIIKLNDTKEAMYKGALLVLRSTK